MRGRGRGRGRPFSCLLFILTLHLFLTISHSIQFQVIHIAESLVLFNHKQQILTTVESSSATGSAFPPAAAPPPSSGGDLPSLPSDGWASPPTTPNSEPSPSPSSEDGIPFISSNPAVPIPTGETDTTTIRPLPISGDGSQAVVGLGWKDRIQMEVVVGLGVIMPFALNLWW